MTSPTSRKKKVLIIKYAGIGDIIMTLPAYYYLVEKHGVEDVDWLVDKTMVAFLEIFVPKKNIIIVDVLAIHRGFVARVNAVLDVMISSAFWKYSCVYNLHGHVYYKVFTTLSRGVKHIANRINSRQPNVRGRYLGLNTFSFVSNQDGPINDFTTYFTILLNKVDDIIKYTSYSVPEHNYFVVCPGYGGNIGDPTSERRRFSIDKWQEIIAKMSKESEKVFIIGGGAEEKYFSKIFESNVEMLFGKLSFQEIFRLMRYAQVVLCTDSGLMHMAYISSKKVVPFFGPTSYFERIPKNLSNVAFVPQTTSCAPCFDGRLIYPCQKNVCLSGYSVDAIVNYAISRD